MSGAELQAGSAGAFQRAAANGLSDSLPVPIRQVMDPAKAPAEFLPFLAVHEGVRLWFADWSESRQRQIIIQWPELASMIGTRAAAERFLAFVDTEIVHKLSYPVRKPVGRISAGRRTPIQLPPFTAQYLVKTSISVSNKTVCVGRTAAGRAAVRALDRTPMRRAMTALSTAKAPATAYSINFAHRIQRTLDDGLNLDAGVTLGEFKDRKRL